LFFDEMGHYSFGSRIEHRRHAFVKRSDLSDSHARMRCKRTAKAAVACLTQVSETLVERSGEADTGKNYKRSAFS
jgi:hypothetical protein